LEGYPFIGLTFHFFKVAQFLGFYGRFLTIKVLGLLEASKAGLAKSSHPVDTSFCWGPWLGNRSLKRS